MSPMPFRATLADYMQYMGMMPPARNGAMMPAAFVPPGLGRQYRDFETENYWLDFGRGGDYSDDSEWAMRLPRIMQSAPERDWRASPLLPRVPYPINPHSRMPMIDPTENDVPWLRPRRQQGAGY